MVSMIFGLPGSGKTTMLAKLAHTEARKIKRGKSRYKRIYSNIDLDIPGVIKIEPYYLGRYDISEGLVLLDEATLFADSRDYKKFSQDFKEFFLLHRHYFVDIFLFAQQWDGVDKKIRVITDRVFYIYKPKLLRCFTRMYRIPYGIIIPDPHKSDGQKLGEIIQGYCKPSFIVRLFSPWVFRPLYYKYFNSFERKELPPIPSTVDVDPADDLPEESPSGDPE